MMAPAEVCMARWFVVRLLGLLVLLAAPSARAGGKGDPPAPSPVQSRAEQLRAEWREAGLAAAPEMIATLCSRNESLIKVAGDELARHGPAAMLQLIRAAAPSRCFVEGVMANIMCAGVIVEDGEQGERLWEEAVAALIAMAGSAERATASRGVSVLLNMTLRYSRRNCPTGDVVFVRAMPALAAELRRDPFMEAAPRPSRNRSGRSRRRWCPI